MKEEKKKTKKLDLLKDLLYVLTFLIITTPLIFFFGPYDKTRKTAISTLMATRHSYWLTNIFSDDTLNRMMGTLASQEAFNNDEIIDQQLDKIDVKYKNSNEIRVFKDEKAKYNAYIIEINNPFRVKATMTRYLGQRGERTSEMAEEKGAIAAINGGAFIDKSIDGIVYAGTGSLPGGFVISNGKVIYPTEGYNDKTMENVVAITKEGKLVVGDHSLSELQNKYKVQEAMCFRKPNIIINGEKQIKDKFAEGLNPRTAIGQKADGTIIFLVIDGRKLTMPGASLYDVQEIMAERGAVNAGALDGGYSSTMIYKDDLVNSPNVWDGERTVATAFYVED